MTGCTRVAHGNAAGSKTLRASATIKPGPKRAMCPPSPPRKHVQVCGHLRMYVCLVRTLGARPGAGVPPSPQSLFLPVATRLPSPRVVPRPSLWAAEVVETVVILSQQLPCMLPCGRGRPRGRYAACHIDDT